MSVIEQHERMMTGRDRRRKKERLGPPTEATSIEDRFRKYHEANPHIYHKIVEKARQVKRLGRVKTYSVAAIFEVIRYEALIVSRAGEPFKLSNDFRSRYARLIMDQERDLAGFFTVRELRAL